MGTVLPTSVVWAANGWQTFAEMLREEYEYGDSKLEVTGVEGGNISFNTSFNTIVKELQEHVADRYYVDNLGGGMSTEQRATQYGNAVLPNGEVYLTDSNFRTYLAYKKEDGTYARISTVNYNFYNNADTHIDDSISLANDSYSQEIKYYLEDVLTKDSEPELYVVVCANTDPLRAPSMEVETERFLEIPLTGVTFENVTTDGKSKQDYKVKYGLSTPTLPAGPADPSDPDPITPTLPTQEEPVPFKSGWWDIATSVNVENAGNSNKDYKAGIYFQVEENGVMQLELSTDDGKIDASKIKIYRVSQIDGTISPLPLADGAIKTSAGEEGEGKFASEDEKTAPLRAGETYVIIIDGEYGEEDIDNKYMLHLTKLSDELYAVDEGFGNVDYNGVSKLKVVKEVDYIFDQLEKMISYMVRGTANTLIKLINLAVGGSNGVTIDDVIFNHYAPTRLLYFNADERNATEVVLGENGEPELDKSGNEKIRAVNPLIRDIAEGIELWSGVFTGIAVTGYLAILLYMGIQILINSTSSRRAEFKRFLIDWIVGLGILFFTPLLVKYAIEMNDDLVASIENQKVAAAQSTTQLTNAKPNMSISADAKAPDINAWSKSLDENPFQNSSNYMAQMANQAESTKRLSYAVVYLIMAWQLLLIVVAYYRRLFLIGFLLVLFPLVALSYAVDKVRDGKSQAFDRWAKEIFLNIFLQTFHAIIYVFAINASFVGGKTNDWIIMILGVSFLFKGEEIIKGLFGQKSDTAASLASSAARTIATFTAVKERRQAIKG